MKRKNIVSKRTKREAPILRARSVLNIGIDLDSTLNNLHEHWLKWIRKNINPNFTMDKWTGWDIGRLSGGGPRVFDFLNIPGTFAVLDVIPGAEQATEELLRMGHNLFVISDSQAMHRAEKTEWIERHFPHLKAIVFTKLKAATGMDVLIDDGLHNFDKFPGIPIVFDRPWNQCSHITTRVKHWHEVPPLIASL